MVKEVEARSNVGVEVMEMAEPIVTGGEILVEDRNVTEDDFYYIVPTVNQLPDGTINFHYDLPDSGIQNYVLVVPVAGQSDITIPCKHISGLT